MLAPLTIFFFCAGSPGNGSLTYSGFEIYFIYIMLKIYKQQQQKILAMVKKNLLWIDLLPLFFSYLDKYVVHFT